MADDDLLHTTEILKAVLPYVDVRTKTTMDLLVKFYELMACIRSMRTNSLITCGYEEQQKPDIETMLNKIRPICRDKERTIIDRILGFFNAKRMYEMYNSYMSVMKTMQEFGGSPFGSDGEAADNMMNNFSGFDFSSIFGKGSDNSRDFAHDTDSENSSEYHEDYTDQEEHEYRNENSYGSEPDEQSKGNNTQMFDMLKNMVPPEQMSTFENLRMLFNTMSYDDNSKPDQRSDEDG